MKKIKEIAVGDYVHIETWKPGHKLWCDWHEEDPDLDIASELNPKEEILPIGDYTLIITYPLSIPYKEKITVEKPWTREQVVKRIVDRYHFIYETENDTSKIKEDLIPGMLNRIATDGAFGIWGHEIGDLDLHTIYINGKNEITLGVDS